MRIQSDDYWPPMPGSWEEAVTPYEEPKRRRIALRPSSDERNEPHVLRPEQPPPPSMPAPM